MTYATSIPWPLIRWVSRMDGAAMVSAAILLLLFIDTIITAFLLGKYRGLLSEVRGLRAGAAPQPSAASSISPADIQAAMAMLTGNGHEA